MKLDVDVRVFVYVDDDVGSDVELCVLVYVDVNVESDVDVGVLVELYDDELVEENVAREEPVTEGVNVDKLVVVAEAVGEEGVNANPRNSVSGLARRMYSPLFPHTRFI